MVRARGPLHNYVLWRLSWCLLAGDYERAVEASNSAEAITSVLYPNDHTTCK